MAYIRTKRQAGRTYYDLVESFRDKQSGKVRQRLILHLPTPKVTERLQEYRLTNGRTDIETQTFEPRGDGETLLLSALCWYESDYEKAKDDYRFALIRNRFGNPEYHWDFGKSEFEEFERMRAQIFKLYEVVTTLRRYAPEWGTTVDRRQSEADRESKATLRQSVKSIVRHRRKLRKTTS